MTMPNRLRQHRGDARGSAVRFIPILGGKCRHRIFAELARGVASKSFTVSDKLAHYRDGTKRQRQEYDAALRDGCLRRWLARHGYDTNALLGADAP